MNEFAEVYMWGTRIGVLHLNNKPFASFEYDRDFAGSAGKAGIEPAPIMMPLSERVYEFPDIANAFHGVPGMIADSLPDKFGNAVINKWLADQGKNERDFNVIDRLCFTGKRGMGALEYVPSTGPDPSEDNELSVSEMVRFASEVLSKKQSVRTSSQDELTYAGLLKLGTSAGGARAKAVVAWNEKTGELRSGQISAGDGFDYWMIKFDGVSRNGDHGLTDDPEYTKIEYAYYLMATECGIKMEECRLLSENGRSHFMTKRFDRVNGEKLHMQTLGALAHIDYNIPGLCGYEQAVSYMQMIGIGKTETEQLFRRMVFNIVASNQDDHVKNISFLMDRLGKWKLAPAYDITFAYNSDNIWLRSHQMSVAGKVSDIEMKDIISAGIKMGLSTRRINEIVEEVVATVSGWKLFAEKAGISEKNYAMINDRIRAILK